MEKNKLMDKDEIMTYIPHRKPMLLVDEIIIDDNDVSTGKYHVTGEEFFLQGHFPGNPVVPGVIICEIMAQSCSLLVGDYLKGKTPFYAGIDKVRFRSSVYPGDTIVTTARITNRRANLFFIDAEATVNGKVCCQGSISFALIDNDKLNK
ncbi:MAG: 3-hydroxyacyl-ACP dehydratase FabZ [Tidjanibacter sp.]|nr:3-hydroxyacyl-ACP dehydratase FabZ [Tidjanibacter sp.]